MVGCVDDQIAELKLQLADRDRTEAAQAAEIKAMDTKQTAAVEEHRTKLLEALAGDVRWRVCWGGRRVSAWTFV